MSYIFSMVSFLTISSRSRLFFVLFCTGMSPRSIGLSRNSKIRMSFNHTRLTLSFAFFLFVVSKHFTWLLEVVWNSIR